MKKRSQTWDPLSQVGNTVDAILEAPARKNKTEPKANREAIRRVGRPRVEGRRRLIASINATQFKKLRQMAVDRDVDISTVVREALMKAGF
jgi:hypothetical protein